jgi:5-methylcytosine-specific restriction enzyme subunit McrC
MVSKAIIVYEHSKLHIGEQGFEDHHFLALVKFNDLHGQKYFEIGYKKIVFTSYIGVIQIGDRLIEILPNADHIAKSDGEGKVKGKWQSALLNMLRVAGHIKLNPTKQASQQLRRSMLFDIYINCFLQEVEQLIHAGLVKKYSLIRHNGTVLRGRLLIEKQMQYNLIHKERFFTEHFIYDMNNCFNAVLKRALEIIKIVAINSSIRADAAKHLLFFEHIDSWKGAKPSLDKLVTDRKTKAYDHPIALAKMIILNYNPGMTAGSKSVLAILFDMNRLFERFIYCMLKRGTSSFHENSLTVTWQAPIGLWNGRNIFADILLEYKQEGEATKIIVDAKWKMGANIPSIEDLKQMFTYNMQFGARKAFLLYPHTDQASQESIQYANSLLAPHATHSCGLYFANIFTEEGEIDTLFAESALNYFMLGKP